MRCLKQCVGLMLLFGFLPPAKANSDDHVIWGYGHFPPYLYVHKEGNPTGPFVELVDKVFDHAGLTYQAIPLPNRRARRWINEGTLQFAITAKSALDNPDDFYVSSNAVAQIDMRAYWLGAEAPISQISDLRGKSVILISSYNYSGLREFIENPVNQIKLTVNVEDHKRALTALKLKRGDYMLAYKQPVELVQERMNIAQLQSFPVMQSDIFFTINKSVKNARQIMDRLDASYAALYLQN